MEVTVQFRVDLNNAFEQGFIAWIQRLDSEAVEKKNQRIKEAVMTGYFIVENGINAYYKQYYEKDFKALCEDEMNARIIRAVEEKDILLKQMRTNLEVVSDDSEKRVDMLAKANAELQGKVATLLQQMQHEREEAKKEALGFYSLKSQKEMELIELDNTARVKDLQYKLERALGELDILKSNNQHELESFKQKDYKYMEDKYQSELQSLKDVTMKMDEQVSYFKGLVEEKDALLKDAYKNDIKERIHGLEVMLQQKDAELSTLKTCNFVKGFTGENIILSFLRENYPKHDIHHTGKVAHEGDIQMIDPKDDSLIVIESKYKQAIDKNDVEKFCRDVSTVCQKEGAAQCVGGIFVSLLTRNIPGKGDAHFEMIGHVPVMYVGFSSIDEFNVYFKKYTEMFLSLCVFYKAQGAKRSDIGDFIEEMNFYFNMLVKNKSRVEDFKTNCLSKLNKFVGDIESDNKMILTRVEDMLKKNNALKYNNMHTCERCGEVFSQKRLLTKHIKSCGSTTP